jgi:hypothetical protein
VENNKYSKYSEYSRIQKQQSGMATVGASGREEERKNIGQMQMTGHPFEQGRYSF